MDAAVHVRRPNIPPAALATSAVVAATVAAAVAMWTALPVDSAGGQPTAPTPVHHARPTTMAGMRMSGMKMPGMKMPMPTVRR
jgi:hypothetical protein